MERKRNADELKWKKLGGGSLRFNKKIIKPGEIFYAKKEDIPAAFMDVLQCLDEDKLEQIEKDKVVQPKDVVEVVYTIVKDAKASKKNKVVYNIIDQNKKVINEEPMSKTEAEETVKALT